MSPTKPNRDGAMEAADAKGREPRGDAAGNRRHPPHVTENFEDAPVQDEVPSPRDVEGLPANASGREEGEVGERAQPIDPASAYDRRPAEDKDRPASSSGGA